MATKKNPPKLVQKVIDQPISETTGVYASEIEEELAQIPVQTVASIAASLYIHDQYPAISLLKAYELLAGAAIARDAMRLGADYKSGTLRFDVTWNDKRRSRAFEKAAKHEPHLPKKCNPMHNDVYDFDDVMISFMPNHSPSERLYKLEEFLDCLDALVEEENDFRKDAKEGCPDWEAQDDGIPPEPSGFEVGMIWNPTKQITEWQKNGVPHWFYEIARHRIWPWLKAMKHYAKSRAAKSRWDKNPSTGADQSGSAADAKPKSKKGMVKSKKDKRLGPRLPEAGKKIKKIIEGS
jgi:hypothetical protein